MGDAAISPAYRLHARFVIHTAGPVWQGGHAGEPQKLRSCYARRQAVETAVQVCTDFLREHDMQIWLVVYDRDAFELSAGLYQGICDYLGENFEPEPDRHRTWERLCAEAARYGIAPERAVRYRCDATGTALSYEAVSHAVSETRRGAKLGCSWKARIEQDLKKRG